MDNLYSITVNKIREFALNRLFELEQEFMKNRAAHIQKFNEELFTGIEKDSPLYTLASLTAKNITIGSEDGYPSYILSNTIRKILFAADNAGLLISHQIGSIKFHDDYSGICLGSSLREQDYHSWNDLESYRKKQTWQKL